MINDIPALRAALDGTGLEAREILELRVQRRVAFALQTNKAAAEDDWRAARAKLEETGRWPVLIMAADGGPWEHAMRKNEWFSRFYFDEEEGTEDTSVDGLLRAADAVDLDAWLARVEAQGEPSEEIPEEDELPPEQARQEWFGQDPCAILFLPTKRGWDSLAYLNFFGSYVGGTPGLIALARSWEERHGAELVAHYGTMLQCLVSLPPASLEEATPLARQHELVAPCTLALPCLTLREYARGLVNYDRWFLHDRP